MGNMVPMLRYLAEQIGPGKAFRFKKRLADEAGISEKHIAVVVQPREYA